MATDKMYDMAFAFRETKLWDLMSDEHLFAVLLPDGAIGYCSVMGALGEHRALALYVGQAGYLSYRKLRDNYMKQEKDFEYLICQDCLQCSLEDKDMLYDEEVAEVRQYAKAHHIDLNKPYSFPAFLKMKPGKFPWYFETDQENERICFALSAAVVLSRILRKKTKSEIGLLPLNSGRTRIPLLRSDGKRWTLSHTELPPLEREAFPAPVFENEILAARIRNTRKTGLWECGTRRLSVPIKSEQDPVPYYPLIMGIYGEDENVIYPPIMTEDNDAEEMLEKFTELVLSETPPSYIYTSNERCYSLLEDFCKKTGIQLSLEEDLPELEEVLDELYESMNLEDLQDENTIDKLLPAFLEEIPYTDDRTLKGMPPKLVARMQKMADNGELPEEIAERIRRLFPEEI